MIASASVFASGVDHCRSGPFDVEVEDHREVHLAVRFEIARGPEPPHLVAVRSRFRDLVLMSICVTEVP